MPGFLRFVPLALVCLSLGSLPGFATPTGTPASGAPTVTERASEACRRGSLRGCYRWGYLEFQAGRLGPAKDAARVGCLNLRHRRLCRVLGELEVRGGNLGEARRFLGPFCKSGESQGCTTLVDAEIRAGNTSVASRLAQVGCRRGNRDLCKLRVLAQVRARELPAETLARSLDALCVGQDDALCLYTRGALERDLRRNDALASQHFAASCRRGYEPGCALAPSARAEVATAASRAPAASSSSTATPRR